MTTPDERPDERPPGIGNRGLGRPSLLTDERQQRIVDAVRAGNYLKVAAQWAGISERTLMGWLARGRAAQALVDRAGDGADPTVVVDPTELPYLQFLQEVQRAEPAAEVAAVTALRGAFTDDWRAAVAFLTHSRARERWTAVTRVTMTADEAERRIDNALDEAIAAAMGDDDDPPLDDDLDADLAEAIGHDGLDP